MKKVLFVIVSIISFALACKKPISNVTNTKPTPVDFITPDGFPAVVYDFSENPLTKEGIALGKKLFYDGRLSKDGNFACASCHQQFSAFATYDHDFSHGFNNAFTKRNTPALQNLAWSNTFHRDGGVVNLEMQALAPILAPNEMAEDLNNVLSKLSSDITYKQMFTAAYGSDEITTAKMLKAIAQFETQLISADSKYDNVRKGTASFSGFEQEGYNLFKQKCAVCHKEPLFTDNSFRNIGLSLNSFTKDIGRMAITGNKLDSLKFKVPSLRNVALTFPYMHDGRFGSLLAVLNHYTSNVVQDISTDPLVVQTIPLTTLQKNQLVAFLQTLTDDTFIKNPQLAN